MVTFTEEILNGKLMCSASQCAGSLAVRRFAMVRTFDHGDGWKQGLKHLWPVNYFTKTIHHHHHRHHHLEDLSSNAANYVKGNNPSRQ